MPFPLVSTPETTSTVQSQSPTNDPITSQPDLFTEQHTSTTPQQPATTQPQPSTTQQQTSPTQPTTQEYIKTQISTKDPPYTAKQLFSETTSISTTSPIPTTTKPQHTTTKEPNTPTQENLYTRKTQPRNKMQRLRPFRFRGTSKHQTTHTYPLPKNTSYYQSSTVTLSEFPNTKPPTTTQSWSTNSYSVTNTALTSTTTLTNIQDDITSQQTTDVSRQPVFSTTPSTYKIYSILHIPTTEDPPLNKNVQELTRQPVYLPITFGYKPQPSTTTQQSNTPKEQASTAKFNLKQHIQEESQSHNPEEWLPGTQKPLLNLTPKTAFIKFDAIQNSPVTEQVTVRTSQQDQPTGNFSPSHVVLKKIS